MHFLNGWLKRRICFYKSILGENSIVMENLVWLVPVSGYTASNSKNLTARFLMILNNEYCDNHNNKNWQKHDVKQWILW